MAGLVRGVGQLAAQEPPFVTALAQGPVSGSGCSWMAVLAWLVGCSRMPRDLVLARKYLRWLLL